MTCAKRIIDFIHKEMGTGLTMLFLPYKADMWDSLESVYLEAKKEDNAYVYPIPYKSGDFDKKAWVKDDFPVGDDLINHIDFKVDVAFIHYPYDDLNKITKIPPTFFSENVYANSRKLIYIPYFVANLNESLISQKAVVYSDYVVVEDEEQVKQYVETLKGNGIDVNPSKFLPFGSPKYDSLESHRHKYPEWDEWKQTFGKQIVFYNTSVCGMLRGDISRIQMLRDNFEKLSKNTNIVVWWRPHPLIESMVEFQRPDLKDEWYRLVSDFVTNKWGIFDNSRDFQRAMEVSDWCISDGSSVVKLCKRMNKQLVMEGDLWKEKY